jgi:hypothetical protein
VSLSTHTHFFATSLPAPFNGLAIYSPHFARRASLHDHWKSKVAIGSSFVANPNKLPQGTKFWKQFGSPGHHRAAMVGGD